MMASKRVNSCSNGSSRLKKPYESKTASGKALDRMQLQDDTAETEGERQLRRLLNQQLDKNITLEMQFERHREFRSSAPYESFTHKLSGQLSSAEFSAINGRKQRIDRLRQLGLNDCEVLLKMNGDSLTQNKEPGAFKQQMDMIESKIEMKEAELSQSSAFREAKQLSRHEMDLEKSLKPNSQRAQLYSNLVTSKPTSASQQGLHPHHPLNHLRQLERELSEKVDAAVVATRVSRANTTTTTTTHEDTRVEQSGPAAPETETETKEGGVSESRDHVISDSSSVITESVTFVSEDEIVVNRLSEDEIRALRPFQDYMRGNPSRVLYLKNLSSNVEDSDLIALFGRFQNAVSSDCPPISYRRMNGRMKGQAFVKFPDASTAEQALQLVHGLMWKGRPIVIQFGQDSSPAGSNTCL